MIVDRIGQQFGNYRLLRSLGQGGFAEVYLGEHVHLGSRVAVKVLHTRLIEREQEQFLREARTIASLDHPAIVRVLDCGVEHGVPFLIMTYAPYGSLGQLYPRGKRLPVSDILAYASSIAAALSYAHDRKLIHRDIKPENILLGPRKEVLLSDFGIAVISSSSTSQSAATTAGTMAYMAPEQIMGKARAASDQYALGIMIYEWLCGELPFQGTFLEVCTQHLYAPPPPLSEKGVTVAPALEKVVLKALAKEPAARFASIQEFAEALEQCIQPSVSHRYSTDMMVPFSPLSLLSDKGVKSFQTKDAVTTISSTRRRLLWMLITIACLLMMTLLVLSPTFLPQHPIAPIATPFSAHIVPQATTKPPHATPVPSISVHQVTPTSVPRHTVSPTPAASLQPASTPAATPTAQPRTSQSKPAAPKPTAQLVVPTPTAAPTVTLQVSPSSLTAGSSPACFDEGDEWVCKLTLTASGPAPGRLKWSMAISGDMAGVSTDILHGRLSVGQSRQLTIYVPDTSSDGGCSNASFVFSGSFATVTVPWTCS